MSFNVLMTTAFLVVGGILAAASLIVAKKPNAQQLIDKLTPYQGWVGIVLFIWGIYDLIHLLGNIGVYFKASVLISVFLLVAVPTELVVGFLLGFGLITKYALSKNATAMEKGQQIRGKLAAFQGPLGLVAIGVGVVYFLLNIIL
jgi:hypothetical protein